MLSFHLNIHPWCSRELQVDLLTSITAMSVLAHSIMSTRMKISSGVLSGVCLVCATTQLRLRSGLLQEDPRGVVWINIAVKFKKQKAKQSAYIVT